MSYLHEALYIHFRLSFNKLGIFFSLWVCVFIHLSFIDTILFINYVCPQYGYLIFYIVKASRVFTYGSHKEIYGVWMNFSYSANVLLASTLGDIEAQASMQKCRISKCLDKTGYLPWCILWYIISYFPVRYGVRDFRKKYLLKFFK